MFKNIIHDLDEPVSIYKLTTIGEVRSKLFNLNIDWASLKDNDILEKAVEETEEVITRNPELNSYKKIYRFIYKDE